MNGRVHIIGAGIAGLAAASEALAKGRAVSLYERTNHAGGRCRSFYDTRVGAHMDNGTHILLKGNEATLRYCARLWGQADMAAVLQVSPSARFDFYDAATDKREALCLGSGRHWFTSVWGGKRLAGTRLGDYAAAWHLWRAGEGDSVHQALWGKCSAQGYARLWHPLCLAVMNSTPQAAHARTLWRVLCRTVGRGGDGCRVLLPVQSLDHALVAPAVRYMEAHAAQVHFSRPVLGISTHAVRAQTLHFADGDVVLAADDALILAVPPLEAARLLPHLFAAVPRHYNGIFNVHVNGAGYVSRAAGNGMLLGVLNSPLHWIQVRGTLISLSVSAFDGYGTGDTGATERETFVGLLWHDAVRALAPMLSPMPRQLPPHRVVWEKRATIAQTPLQNRQRPSQHTALTNTWLVGDWTQTGLCASIEGAISAAETAMAQIISK